MTKSAKIDIYLWPKRLKNHTLWGRTYLYSPYKGVPPRVMIGQGKLQILVINDVTSLGSGPRIPTRFFRENSSGPYQSLFIFVFQPILLRAQSPQPSLHAISRPDFGGNLFCQNRSINPRKPIRSHFHSNKIFQKIAPRLHVWEIFQAKGFASFKC